LDRDVNEYLDFKIPPAFDKPITLRDIMTHRAGFEETIKDLLVGSTGDLHAISQYLQSHMPSRSAVDMTHFMIMHLQNGQYRDVQVLRPETTMQMHAR
jgi:CubicO group peptidase (beta-lactamase class C family)